MKLYEVPNNTQVRIVTTEDPPPGALPTWVGQVILFNHIDGMYSYCTDEDNHVVHLKAWTEVDILEAES